MKCPLNKVAKVLSVALLTAVAVAFTSCGGSNPAEYTKKYVESLQKATKAEQTVKLSNDYIKFYKKYEIEKKLNIIQPQNKAVLLDGKDLAYKFNNNDNAKENFDKLDELSVKTIDSINKAYGSEVVQTKTKKQYTSLKANLEKSLSKKNTEEKINNLKAAYFAEMSKLTLSLLEKDEYDNFINEVAELKESLPDELISSIQEKLPKELKRKIAKLVTLNKEEDFKLEISDDGTYIEIAGLVSNHDEHPINIEIPAEIQGLPVRVIGKSAFEENQSIKHVKLPESVREIYDYAFRFSSLESIELPSGLEYIGNRCFKGSNLVSINIPDVKKISDYVFEDCKNLKNVSFPDKVENLKKIGYYWFYGCKSLTSINLPEGLEVIGYHSFSNCDSLETVTLPSTINEFGQGCFYKCKNLKTIHIPDNITKCRFKSDYMHECFSGTNLPLATQKRLRDLGYESKFN